MTTKLNKTEFDEFMYEFCRKVQSNDWDDFLSMEFNVYMWCDTVRDYYGTFIRHEINKQFVREIELREKIKQWELLQEAIDL